MTAPQPYPGDLPGNSGPAESRPLNAYPGDLPASQRAAARPPFRRVFLDSLGRPLAGQVTFRPSRGVGSVTVPLVDGVLQVQLTPGQYRMVGTLKTVDGAFTYAADDVNVEAYW